MTSAEQAEILAKRIYYWNDNPHFDITEELRKVLDEAEARGRKAEHAFNNRMFEQGRASGLIEAAGILIKAVDDEPLIRGFSATWLKAWIVRCCPIGEESEMEKIDE